MNDELITAQQKMHEASEKVRKIEAMLERAKARQLKASQELNMLWRAMLWDTKQYEAWLEHTWRVSGKQYIELAKAGYTLASHPALFDEVDLSFDVLDLGETVDDYHDIAIPIPWLLSFTLSAVEHNDDDEVITFTRTDGVQVKMYHEQECCEHVRVEEIHGDLQALVGYPLTTAEVFTRDGGESEDGDDRMFTFYRIGNERHLATIRWCGESHHYSIDVTVEVVK